MHPLPLTTTNFVFMEQRELLNKVIRAQATFGPEIH